jgi:hypothetical protein
MRQLVQLPPRWITLNRKPCKGSAYSWFGLFNTALNLR